MIISDIFICESLQIFFPKKAIIDLQRSGRGCYEIWSQGEVNKIRLESSSVLICLEQSPREMSTRAVATGVFGRDVTQIFETRP